MIGLNRLRVKYFLKLSADISSWYFNYIIACGVAVHMANITPDRRQSKTLILSTNVDKNRSKKFLIAICRPAGDKWQSKILFLSIFDPLSSTVTCKSVFDYRLSRVNICVRHLKPRSHCPGLRCRFIPVWWSGMNRVTTVAVPWTTLEIPGWTVLNRIMSPFKTTGTHRE